MNWTSAMASLNSGRGNSGSTNTNLRNTSENVTLYVGSSAIAANAIDYLRYGSATADSTK